jgi:hypothetical protein
MQLGNGTVVLFMRRITMYDVEPLKKLKIEELDMPNPHRLDRSEILGCCILLAITVLIVMACIFVGMEPWWLK